MKATLPPSETSLEKELLAVRGGSPAVTAKPPPSWGLGPAELGEEEIEAVTRVMRSKSLFRFQKDRADSMVARFEDLFAEKTGVRHALAVNSGTSALICGLVGIGVSQGDEVLVPAYTYIATAAAVLALGAFPIIVEIDGALTMDVRDIEGKITSRTKAIIPVHMRGVCCDMAAIMEIARRRGLVVLEDCAQANGGFYKGKALGTWGDAGAFSLQQFKIITAGEGGAVVTNDKNVFDRAAIYHDSAYMFWMEGTPQGVGGSPEAAEEWKSHCFLGENYRQSEVHGAIAFEQLKKRDRILARTRLIKKQLREACAEIPGAELEVSHDLEGDCGISLAIFMEDGARAQEVAKTLQAEGVPCGTRFSRQIPDRHIFYHWDYVMQKRSPHLNGFPWSTQPEASRLEYSKEMCPRTIAWMERAVVFVITQTMTDDYVAQVAAAIRKVARLL